METTKHTLDTDLATEHYTHLLSEGFTEHQIWELEQFGVKSLTKLQALKEQFKVWDDKSAGFLSDAGLKFPFTKTFAQIRFDTPLVVTNKAGKERKVKYLSPSGAHSEAFLPDGVKVITEGAKDAWAGIFYGGIPTGCLAGVSHTEKALKEGCGYTILFDSDGWKNPNVAQQLIKSAQWCEGKIQLVPEIQGEPKGGLCEYFKAGATPEDYADLIASAMWPDQFLWEWMKRWQNYSDDLKGRCLKVTLKAAEDMRLAA